MALMPDRETMERIGELFKGFADASRVRILYALTQGELCVTDIAQQMQLIKFLREGKNILYSLADDHVKTILQMGLEHILE